MPFKYFDGFGHDVSNDINALQNDLEAKRRENEFLLARVKELSNALSKARAQNKKLSANLERAKRHRTPTPVSNDP
jgi:hypothetical protein